MNMIVLVFVTLLAIQCRMAEPLPWQGIRSKGGVCPYQRPAVNCGGQGFLFSSEDEPQCFEDSECSESMKCCMQGCVHKCVSPVRYRRWCTAPLDLGILFDTQADIWKKAKKMVNKVIHKMSVYKTGTHIALATTYSQSLLTFDQLTDSQMNPVKVWSIVKDVVPTKRSGKLSTSLEMAREMFNESNGAREDAIKVLLVLTDAQFDSDENVRVKAAAKSLKESGILVQSVGISMDLNIMHLVEIATSDFNVWPEVDHELLEELKKLEKRPCSKE